MTAEARLDAHLRQQEEGEQLLAKQVREVNASAFPFHSWTIRLFDDGSIQVDCGAGVIIDYGPENYYTGLVMGALDEIEESLSPF